LVYSIISVYHFSLSKSRAMTSLTYLDHAASSPLRKEVADAMQKVSRKQLGNPSSIHAAGRAARGCIDEAREQVAALVGATASEITFTSGATESNNLALKGVSGDLVTNHLEHPSVDVMAGQLASHGGKVSYLPNDKEGVVTVEKLKKLLTPETGLVSLMYVNNEIGTIQQVAEAAKIIKAYNEEHKVRILLHVDAVQGMAYLNSHKDHLRADLISFSAHKLGGPAGVGALFVRQGVRIGKSSFGGEQERGLRPGTENLLGITGFGKACELALKNKESESQRLAGLRELLLKKLLANKKVALNGSTDGAPHIINVSVAGKRADELVIAADLLGVCISSGSACSSGSVEPSRVIAGLKTTDPASAIRISLGWDTNETIVKSFIEVFGKITA
jgi:cysteine desulfurase